MRIEARKHHTVKHYRGVMLIQTPMRGNTVNTLCLHRTATPMGLTMAEPCILLTVSSETNANRMEHTRCWLAAYTRSRHAKTSWYGQRWICCDGPGIVFCNSRKITRRSQTVRLSTKLLCS